jgi:site-specific DNA-methyltransferase (adenine-specific)
MEATLDVWEIAPESAQRVRHPAPFPVELPERLIRLYTFRDDLVLDPFMGSGSTLVAAARWGRRYVGYDLDGDYVKIAKARVAAERKAVAAVAKPGKTAEAAHENDELAVQALAAAEGKPMAGIAERVLERAGFTVSGRNVRQRGLGLVVPLVAEDQAGARWYFDLTGGFTTTKGGLSRTDTALRAVGRASILRARGHTPLVHLTSHLPRPGTDPDRALRAVGPAVFFDAVELLSEAGRERLEKYALGGHQERPVPGFWTDAELDALG